MVLRPLKSKPANGSVAQAVERAYLESPEFKSRYRQKKKRKKKRLTK
jgi:hypothetical protein